MKLNWAEEKDYNPGQDDLNMYDELGIIKGWFSDYKKQIVWWSLAGQGTIDLEHLTLEEAKAVVEAMVRLEG